MRRSRSADLDQPVLGPRTWIGGTPIGAAQAVPGPLFSLSAYLGFILDTTPTRWAGAALALVAIFLPSYLLVVGALPFWARLRRSAISQSALRGTSAAVVGLLVAAFHGAGEREEAGSGDPSRVRKVHILHHAEQSTVLEELAEHGPKSFTLGALGPARARRREARVREARAVGHDRESSPRHPPATETGSSRRAGVGTAWRSRLVLEARPRAERLAGELGEPAALPRRVRLFGTAARRLSLARRPTV